MKLTYCYSDLNEIELIHERSLDILNNIGVIFQSKEAIEIFKNNGAKTDKYKVFISRQMVENALNTVPMSFEWYGRNKSNVVGDGNSCNVPAYGPILINENNEYHSATPEDFAKFHILHESSKIIHAGNPNVLEPTQVPKEIRAKYQMATSLMYHTKPVMGMTAGKEVSKMSIKMSQEFYDTRNKCVVVGLISCAAPMHYTTDMADALIEYSKENQAVVITGGGMSGLTMPSSMASNILASNAGILAGIVLSQIVNPGTPVVYGFPATSSDLRYSLPSLGGPETALFIHSCKEIGNYYKLPVRAGGALTDAKYNDYQSGYESFMTTFSTYLSGIDFVLHTCGIMDTFNTIGYEKFILDEELITVVQRYLRGFEVTEDLLLYDKLAKAGPDGDFLARTNKIYLNDYMLPKLVNRESIQNWKKNGKLTVDHLARKACKERLEQFIMPENTKHQQKIIDNNIPKEFLYK